MCKDKKIKVCIVVISLGGGGLERSVALLSQMLSKRGYEIHMVLLQNRIDYPYSGLIFNLGEHKKEKDNFLSRLLRFRRLGIYFKQQQFDIVIDSRVRNSTFIELLYQLFVFKKTRQVFMIHSFIIDNYLPNGFESCRFFKRIRHFVGVSKEISKAVSERMKTNNVSTIYNSAAYINTNLPVDNTSSPYILSLGRIVDKVKNYTLLIDAYYQSGVCDQIKLKIMGDGPDLSLLKAKVEDLGLTNHVEFLPFSTQVEPVIKQAKFLTLTSKNEGFPMILIEALTLGVPVVSVDCKSGPNEVVVNGYNGLLVENNNIPVFASAISRMVDDQELYLRCCGNAKESVSHLDFDTTAAQWDVLLRSLL